MSVPHTWRSSFFLYPLRYTLFIVSQKLIKFATWNKMLIWKLKLLTTAQLQS